MRAGHARTCSCASIAEFLGLDPATHPLGSWMSVLERVRRLSDPVVVLDDLPHVLANDTDLPEAVARYADLKNGPVLVLAGTSQTAMLRLMATGSPLFGKVAMALSPSPLAPRDLARLWGVERPTSALRVDAVVGALPAYQRRRRPRPGDKLAAWMRSSVLAPAHRCSTQRR